MEKSRRRPRNGLNLGIQKPVEKKSLTPDSVIIPEMSTPKRGQSSNKSRTRMKRREQEVLHDSSPYNICSQVVDPAKEVFWDYDTPQMRKYRAKNGLDSSPSPSPLRLSTPKLKLQARRRPEPATQMVSKGALDAFNEILNFCKRVESKAHAVKSEPEEKIKKEMSANKSEPQATIKSEAVVATPPRLDWSIGSEDDSMLVAMTQAAEESVALKQNGCLTAAVSEAVNRHKPSSAKSKKTSTTATAATKPSSSFDIDADLFSDDSFDEVLSQIDEQQLIANDKELEVVTVSSSPVLRKQPASSIGGGDGGGGGAAAGKRPMNISVGLAGANNQPLVGNNSGAKPFKRFKSCDDAGLASSSAAAAKSHGGGGGFSFRRVASSPAVPRQPDVASPDFLLAKSPPKCTKAEIERKKAEAKRRREQSQMARRFK